ncbi:hypothetical protein GCM10007063_09640 [Lentibacillus kapialis]|uniref:Uncharacterized protein n=1 Tax=Lentibacillus kapialis TaxID=340214 RepID=A0A917UVW2_9BACI|nr:hypothetical protein [Lentibacillus kapialis]GGJ89067.1 hypothetical protein GCM10007063_09640 [Lentibacillus kapialis]
MKRYLYLVAVASIIVLTFSAYYIQQTITSGSYPEIVIEKVSGNEDKVEDLMISGSYRLGFGMGDNVKVDIDETVYSSEQPFPQRFGNRIYGDNTNRLQDRYRRFMRGKSGSVRSFLETDNVVAYANVIGQSLDASNQDMTFDMAVLNKQTEESTSFTVPVPDKEAYSQVTVEDVQMIDNELYVITQNIKVTGANSKRIYRFNFNEQNMTGEDVITSYEDQKAEAVHTRIRKMGVPDETKAQEYVVFFKEHSVIGQGTDTAREITESGKEYIAYKLKTNEKKQLELPKSLSVENMLIYKHGKLYMRDGHNLLQYDITKGETEKEMQLPEQGSGFPTPVAISDDTIYVLTANEQSNISQISVFDLTSGDLLYNGKIKPEKPLERNVTLQLYDLSIS